MKATPHKFIEVQQGATAKEIMAAIRAIVKAEGKQALSWPIWVLPASQDQSGGMTTGLPAQFPDNKADDVSGRRLIGFKREQ